MPSTLYITHNHLKHTVFSIPTQPVLIDSRFI